MSQAHIHQSWESPAEMNGYPMPIIDEKKDRQFAGDRVYSLRKKAIHTAEAEKIVTKHANRKKIANRKKR
mgnify:CR=1 FL=1